MGQVAFHSIAAEKGGDSLLELFFFASITCLVLSFICFVKLAKYMSEQLLNNECCLHHQVIWVVCTHVCLALLLGIGEILGRHLESQSYEE